MCRFRKKFQGERGPRDTFLLILQCEFYLINMNFPRRGRCVSGLTQLTLLLYMGMVTRISVFWLLWFIIALWRNIRLRNSFGFMSCPSFLFKKKIGSLHHCLLLKLTLIDMWRQALSLLRLYSLIKVPIPVTFLCQFLVLVQTIDVHVLYMLD